MPASKLLLLFSLLLLPLALSRSLQPPQPTALVQSTCNVTTYYDLCVAALAADPATPAATSTAALSSIAVAAAKANATATISLASSLADAATSNPPLRKLLRTCSAKYGDARDALRSASDAIKTESYDYAFVHVSAAAEYPNVCKVLFRRQAPRVAYPPELARREVGLEQLCTVALDIISLLG